MVSATHNLELFARDSLLKGLKKEDIRKAMLDAGGAEDCVRSALGAYADLAFPVPVPKPRVHLSAREAFLYLVLFTTLYLSAYHFGSLLFDFINRTFPDPAARSYAAALGWHGMRWSVSSLIIAFPAFLFVSHHIGKAVARNPMLRLSSVRRWLTYLTLFVTAAVLIGDLTTLVYSALGGELTTRIALKVAVVALIAGTIFGYYLLDLRREERE